jgi:hypothetical protein
MTPERTESTVAPAETVGAERRRHPFVWVVWLTTAVVALVFAYAVWLLILEGGATAAFGWTEVHETAGWFVDAVDPDGPAAGLLRPGDRVIAMSRVPPIGNAGTLLHRRELSPGSAYGMTIERNGEQQTLRVGVAAGPSRLATRVTYFISSLLWCLIGLSIGAARPEHPVARLAAAVSVAVGLVFLTFGVFQRGTLWAPLHVVLGYHFFSRFPTGEPARGPWKAVLWLLYLLGGTAGAIAMAFTGILTVQGLSAAARFPEPLLWTRETVGLLGFTGSVAAMIAVLPRNYRRLTTDDQRRRVRWVLYASLVAMVPEVWFAAVALFDAFIGSSGLSRFELAANLSPVIIPISVAYAVVKHRVFDITVVIRLGVQYVLARRALQTLVVLPMIALAYTLVVNRDRTLSDIVTEGTAYGYWIVAAGLSLKFRRPIRLWLDRRFFREEHDREQVLMGLVDQVGKVDSISELSVMVRDKLDVALHPKVMYLWYRDPEESSLVSSSNPELTPADFPAGPWLVWIEGHGEAIELPLPPAAGVAAREARWFVIREVRLVVPLADSRERLIGLLLLGEKKSEEPYTASDRRLLHAVARQTAVARETLRLRATVIQEQRIRHDVLAKLDRRLPDLLKECPACGACFDGAIEVCDRDQQTLTLSLPVSRTIEGKYRLDRLIGKGGMGAVYEARDLRLNRSVAVKIMLGRAFGQQTALRRFHREARAAARLNHPNIVSIYDFGPLEGEGAFLVMERIDGVTMRAALQRATVFAPAEAADWFDQLLDGIAAAHAEGIVHRDLKPENVIGQRVGTRALAVKILDFGLAKIQAVDLQASEPLTVQGIIMGTLGYMSPEQLLGGEIDRTTDVFAVGVMLVETLTGRRPFNGETHAELSRAVLHDDFHLPRSTPETAALDALVQRCLAKDPHDRMASAAELRRELIPTLRACASL